MLRSEWPEIRFSSVYNSAPLHHEEQEDLQEDLYKGDQIALPERVNALEEIHSRNL